jgi:tetratricopeptide (TPR) repeat protein
MTSKVEKLRRQFERSRRLRGDDHPTTVRLRGTLIAQLEARGGPSERLPLWEAEVASQRRIGGPESLAAFNAAIALGDTLRELGRYDEARRCAEELVETTSAVAGESAAATVTAKTLLALTLDDLQCGEALRAFCADLLPAVTAAFGKSDRRTLNVRGCYVAALRRVGDLQAAIDAGRELVASCQRVFGDDSVPTIVSIGNLAAALEDSHAYELAEPLREEALRRYQALFPAGSARVWNAQLALAQLRLVMGHPAEALELQQSVLAALESGTDPTGLVLHDALADVAATHKALGQIADAAATISRHIDLHIANAAVSDPTVAKLRRDLAALLEPRP